MVTAELLTGEADGIGPGKGLLAVDLRQVLAQPAEEVLEHQRVAFDGAPRARAALLGEEGVEPFPNLRWLRSSLYPWS